jgi:hypothetical protein
VQKFLDALSVRARRTHPPVTICGLKLDDPSLAEPLNAALFWPDACCSTSRNPRLENLLDERKSLSAAWQVLTRSSRAATRVARKPDVAGLLAVANETAELFL